MLRTLAKTAIAVTLLSSCGQANDLSKQLQPFFSNYCVSCHGADKQKADFRVDTLDGDLIKGSDADHWQEVLDLVQLGEMPPADAPKKPSRKERQKIVDLLTAAMREAMEAQRSTGGRNVLRRLTAYEYNNTLRDLLGLDLRYATDLPPEGAAQEGFKNNSTVLGTSALHLEYFERIARAALERIILVPDETPTPYFVRIEPELAFAKQKEESDDGKKKNRQKRKPAGSSYTVKGDEFFRPHKNVRGPLFKLDHGEAAGDSILLAGNRPSDKVGDPFAPDRKQGGAAGDGRSGYQPEFRVEMYEVPYDQPVLVRIHAAAVPGKNDSFPRLSFELGSFRGAGVSDQKEAANIEITSTEPQTYEFVVQGANFPFQSNKPGRPSYFRIFNDFRRGTSDLTYDELPKLEIDWVEITSNYHPEWPTPQREAILPSSETRDSVYVREVLQRFMTRAYRRPVSTEEVDRKVALFERLSEQEDSFETTMISTLTAVLCSSHFLMHAEPAPSGIGFQPVAGDRNTGRARLLPSRAQADLGSAGASPSRGDRKAAAATTKRRLNDYELASRLSYFLWSSMPDDRLFELAAAEKLRDPDVLLAEVERMINDPKSAGFAENFAAQWLDLAGIRRLAVNPEYFKFEEKTKDLFEEETIRFLRHVLSANLSITNFIDSEFAVLNPTLARHYRIPGIAGGFEVRHIGEEHHRGGVLTQASMLFGNSTGAETHPIKRGVWVLERMLDDPPPPPPPNVPDLPEPETKDEALLSLKKRLVQHAQVETCRDCHQKIDPWGVAFENYNALGQWREGDRDPLVLSPHQEVDIDPVTQLRNGTEIHDLNDLKKYILTDRRSQFRRAFVRKVMAYALGRYLEFSDRAAVDSICKAVENDDDSFRTVLKRVVLSEPFLMK